MEVSVLEFGYGKMTEKRPEPAPNVRLIEVSIKRELTVNMLLLPAQSKRLNGCSDCHLPKHLIVFSFQLKSLTIGNRTLFVLPCKALMIIPFILQRERKKKRMSVSRSMCHTRTSYKEIACIITDKQLFAIPCNLYDTM